MSYVNRAMQVQFQPTDTRRSEAAVSPAAGSVAGHLRVWMAGKLRPFAFVDLF